jgi:GNAT superfamily N-acetyltransferase
MPEYRGQKLGAMAVREAEKWIAECGYKKIVIDSRLEATGFYEKLGTNSSEISRTAGVSLTAPA